MHLRQLHHGGNDSQSGLCLLFCCGAVFVWICKGRSDIDRVSALVRIWIKHVFSKQNLYELFYCSRWQVANVLVHQSPNMFLSLAALVKKQAKPQVTQSILCWRLAASYKEQYFAGTCKNYRDAKVCMHFCSGTFKCFMYVDVMIITFSHDCLHF